MFSGQYLQANIQSLSWTLLCRLSLSSRLIYFQWNGFSWTLSGFVASRCVRARALLRSCVTISSVAWVFVVSPARFTLPERSGACLLTSRICYKYWGNYKLYFVDRILSVSVCVWNIRRDAAAAERGSSRWVLLIYNKPSSNNIS